jgi:hypothetical protein
MHTIYKSYSVKNNLKIIIHAPTCFGSRNNHHQGAVLCLAKTTKWFICARRYRRSQCYGGISGRCAGVCFALRMQGAYVNILRLFLVDVFR